MVCGLSSSGIYSTDWACDKSKFAPGFSPWSFAFGLKRMAGWAGRPEVRRNPPSSSKEDWPGDDSWFVPDCKDATFCPSFPVLRIQLTSHSPPGDISFTGIRVAVQKGLGVIVVILGAMVPKVITPPAGEAVGYRGGAAPEEYGAPKAGAGPIRERLPDGIIKPEGRGPSTVTVNVRFEVLVTNFVTMTVGRPGVTVTDPEQSLCPVGLNLGG